MKNKTNKPNHLDFSLFENNEEIVSGISHLWRQPLTVFSFGLMSLKKRATDDELSLRIINKLNEQLRYMSSVLENYKQFYTPYYQKEYFDIYERSQAIEEILRPILEINHIEFSIKVEENFAVYGYKYLFEQQLLDAIYKIKKSTISNNTLNPSITVMLNNPKIVVIDNTNFIAPQFIKVAEFSTL